MDLITNKQLSEWLLSEGELLQDGWVSNAYSYQEGKENEKIDDNILIRKWGDSEWHKPTCGYIGV